MDSSEKKNIFMKASGDLFTHPDFIQIVRKCVEEGSHVVICTGGGGQINRMFRELGTGEDKEKHGPLGRELVTDDQKNRARKVLEKNQENLEAILEEEKIKAAVVIPVLDIDGVVCHINGDQMVRASYIGFDLSLIHI